MYGRYTTPIRDCSSDLQAIRRLHNAYVSVKVRIYAYTSDTSVYVRVRSFSTLGTVRASTFRHNNALSARVEQRELMTEKSAEQLIAETFFSQRIL